MLLHLTENIKMLFLPPNAMLLLKSVDQGIISPFESSCFWGTFRKLIREMEKKR